MAITGSGTQADPYVVHSYSEIKNVFENAPSSGSVYCQLANDINCNDYGSSFSWGNIALRYNAASVIFDLNSHIIKNIQITTNQTMFTFGNSATSIIKNGSILNMFMNTSNGFCDYTGGLYSHSKLQNVSISADATGVNSNPFYCGFDSCAVFLEGGSTNYSPFKISNNVSAKMENTDVLLSNAKGYMLFEDTGSQNITNSRIRGKFTGEQNFLASDGNLFNNCVVDLEYNKAYLTGSSGTNTGVINTDKLPSGFNTRGMTSVNSQEIINGAALRAKDFVVVNVVG